MIVTTTNMKAFAIASPPDQIEAGSRQPAAAERTMSAIALHLADRLRPADALDQRRPVRRRRPGGCG